MIGFGLGAERISFLQHTGKLKVGPRRRIRVFHVMAELKRLSDWVWTGRIKRRIKVSLIALAKAGILEIDNGSDRVLDIQRLPAKAYVEFVSDAHEFVESFKKGFLFQGENHRKVMQRRRSDRTIKVSTKVRRGVIYPQELVQTEGFGGFAN